MTIEYKFENKYFDWFKECINSELPDENKLEEDPLEIGNSPTAYIKDIMICLMKLDENFFLLRVLYHGRP